MTNLVFHRGYTAPFLFLNLQQGSLSWKHVTHYGPRSGFLYYTLTIPHRDDFPYQPPGDALINCVWTQRTFTGTQGEVLNIHKHDEGEIKNMLDLNDVCGHSIRFYLCDKESVTEYNPSEGVSASCEGQIKTTTTIKTTWKNSFNVRSFISLFSNEWFNGFITSWCNNRIPAYPYR